MTVEIVVDSERQTDVLGQILAETLPDGAVVALLGTLGAGKTRLVQAVAAASGVPRDEVGSPTFVLVREYEGDRSIFHFDAYRLRDSDEFLELGPDEYFESDGLSFVEWADKVEDATPEDRLEIVVEPIDATSRRFLVASRGEFVPDFETVLLNRWKNATLQE